MKPKIEPGDYHLIVNDSEGKFNSEAKLFNSSGKLLWVKDCLAKGQSPDYSQRNGDTPPGVYKLAYLTVTQDWENAATWHAYGKYFWDLGNVSGAEEKYGRAGVGLHGGGSSAPDPLAPYQQLVPTCGCIRMYNKDLEAVILPLWQETQANGSTIWVSVNQY